MLSEVVNSIVSITGFLFRPSVCRSSAIPLLIVPDKSLPIMKKYLPVIWAVLSIWKVGISFFIVLRTSDYLRFGLVGKNGSQRTGFVLCWNLYLSSPVLNPNRITYDEDKNKSRIELSLTEPLLIANKTMRIYSSANIAANPMLAVVLLTICDKIIFIVNVKNL